jgi:hypothetical protein
MQAGAKEYGKARIEALQESQRRYNDPWLIERHGYRSLAQVRRDLAAPIPAVA